MDDLYDWATSWLLRVVTLPGVLPGCALAVLVVGLRRARGVRLPVGYALGTIVTAGAFLGFSLVPTYSKYTHRRGLTEEWFWQALGLAVPFALLLLGLSILKRAGERARVQHFASARRRSLPSNR